VVDVVTVSTEVFKRRLVRGGCLASKIHVIRSPIDVKKFVPLDKEILKENYGFHRKKIIFYYGSLHENKGPQFLVNVMENINNNNIILVIAPRHHPKEDFIKSIQPLHHKIKVVMEDIDVVEYLNMADVVVLPYKNMKGTEGNPSCLLEAMACQTPVITSHFPELREIVTADEDVLMVTPGDVDELRKQIEKILGDDELQKKLVENAYKKIQEFDVRNVAKEFLKRYSITSLS
jgi:glycosyltransferase involved in cell wall biosynthesis